jgi:hypothetical protein
MVDGKFEISGCLMVDGKLDTFGCYAVIIFLTYLGGLQLDARYVTPLTRPDQGREEEVGHGNVDAVTWTLDTVELSRGSI